ncbi:MAG: SDR family NAD(P)-dependent oxidoreductase [Candidatus Wallbacteria bacterium]|nr:SDR family NAD(P)-dependent oxidoreductase [Candidatus Wallbacteria bacterium]
MSRVVLVTGTSRGIGCGLAQHFLDQGCKVAGCSRGGSSITHPSYTHFQLDVSDETAVLAMVRAVLETHGTIDVLLNNAGIASMNHLTLTPYASARKIFDTNFFGSFLFLRESAKAMIREKAGRIVNFTSVAMPLSLEGEAMYAASKAAVESLTRIASKELAPFGITVNAVGPCPVSTDLVAGVPEAKMQALLLRQAIHRYAGIDDVTNVVDFFVSEKSAFVTGQIVYLGGVGG